MPRCPRLRDDEHAKQLLLRFGVSLTPKGLTDDDRKQIQQRWSDATHRSQRRLRRALQRYGKDDVEFFANMSDRDETVVSLKKKQTELCTSITNITRQLEHEREQFRREIDQWQKALHMLLTFLPREKLAVLRDIAAFISAEYAL